MNNTLVLLNYAYPLYSDLSVHRLNNWGMERKLKIIKKNTYIYPSRRGYHNRLKKNRQLPDKIIIYLMILWILLCQHSKNWLNISNFMSKKPYNIFWASDLYINVIQFVKIRVTVHVIYTEHFGPKEGH